MKIQYFRASHEFGKLTSFTRHQNTLNIPKTKFNMQQPVPSQRFQYKSIGKSSSKCEKWHF